MSSPEAVAPPPPPPTADEELEDRLKIQVVDVSDAVQANAVDRAETYLSRETTQSGVRGFLKRIWQGNIARDYYRQREIQRGRQEIVETGNIYVNQEGSQAQHDEAMAAVVDRFTSDYVHEGETNQQFEDTEHGQQLMGQLQELVSSYARGEFEYDELVEERTRILAEYGHQVHQEDRNRGLVFADNILEVAAQARAAFEHGAALERIDTALSGRIGEARTGVRTETRLEMTDRIIDRLHSTRVGSLVNETTLGLAVGVAMGAAKFTTRKLVTAGAAFVGLGVGAGVIAAGREHLRVGQERTAHSRSMAEGAEITAESHRREEMEQTRYETVAAADLTNQLEAARQRVETGDADALQELIAAATAARARIHASDIHSIDLLNYSSKESVESERLALDIELAQASVAIHEAMEASGQEFDIDAIQQAINEQIVGDISAKDRAFNSLRRRRTIRMGLIGAASGMLAGLGIQEIHSLLDHGLQGVAEGPAGSDRHSLLADIFRHHFGTGQGEHRDMFEGGHHFHDTAVDMPDGYHLVQVHPGEKFGWQIQDSHGKNILDNLDWNKWQQLVGKDHNGHHIHHITEGHTGVGWDTQGNLDHDTRLALRELGWKLDQHHIQFHEPHVLSSGAERTPAEYLAHHPGQFTQVHRELWYDNNTPSIYDHNELKLWWGGSTGTGIDSHGNYVFNVAQMNPDGSYHAGLSTNAQELIHEGKMKLALSMSRDTQSHVFMVGVDSNGNAIIPHDSYIAHSLFENQNGHAHFIGAYAEAVQVMGHNPNGSENIRMLATVVGDNSPHSANDLIHHVVSQEHTHYVTHMEAPSTPIEVPPVVPIYGRRGLETVNTPAPQSEGYGYLGGYEGNLGARERRRGIAPFAREVENNPDAKIDANKSTEKYLNSFSSAYRPKVEKLIKQLDKQPRADRPKVVVMIPAAAHQEGKNIYHTLEQYAKQQNIDKNEVEIVVFANNPEGTKRDNTLDEVRRFQADHPDLKVRLIRQELEKKDAKIGWVRKAMTDAVLSDLKRRGVDLNEVLMVSNDADSQWIDDNYIRTIIDKAAEQPEVDGFLGFIDWGYDAYRAQPELLVSTRMMQMIEMYLRRTKNQIGSSGANFVFRPGAYTAVGGYNTRSELGEDVELGRMIKGMRSGATTRRPIAFLGRSSEVNTSARRALEKLFKDGGAPYYQWDDGFSAYDELRTRDFNLRDFDFSNRQAVRRLIKDSERMLNQTVRAYSGALASEQSDTYRYGRINVFDGETMRNMNRMLSVIGVKVKWNPDGTFKIVNAGRMIANLERWQLSHGGQGRPPIIRREGRQIRLPRAVAAGTRMVERSEAMRARSRERLREQVERFRSAGQESSGSSTA